MSSIRPLDISAEQDAFRRALELGGMSIPGKSNMPISITPKLIEASRFKHLKRNCELVMEALEKVVDLYVNEKKLWNYMPELERFRSHSLMPSSYRRWVFMGRFDIIEDTSGRFRIMETNTMCPGGVLFSPLINTAFEKTPGYQSQVAEKGRTRLPFDHADAYLKALVDLCVTHKGNDRPVLGIINSRYKPLFNDLEQLERSALANGVSVVRCAVQDLTEENGRAVHNGIPIDIAYTKFHNHLNADDQIQLGCFEKSPDEISAFWNAASNDELLYVNSFPSSLVAEAKGVLHLLRVPEVQERLTNAQREAIEALCPLTFPLQSRSAGNYPSSEQIAREKNKWVLKQSLETRGGGVVVGRGIGGEEWEALVNSCADRPWVVQEYIENANEMVVSPDDGSVVPMSTNIGVYILNGQVAGLMCRSARDFIVNVARTGAVRPTYIVGEEADAGPTAQAVRWR